jgi:hypothetical protein
MAALAPLVYGRTHNVDFRYLALPDDFEPEVRKAFDPYIVAMLRRPELLAAGPRLALFTFQGRRVAMIVARLDALLPFAAGLQHDIASDSAGRPLYLLAAYVAGSITPFALPDADDAAACYRFFAPLLAFVDRRWEERSFEVDRNPLEEYGAVTPGERAAGPQASDAGRLELNARRNLRSLWGETLRPRLWAQAARADEPSLALGLPSQPDALASPFLNATTPELPDAERPVTLPAELHRPAPPPRPEPPARQPEKRPERARADTGQTEKLKRLVYERAILGVLSEDERADLLRKARDYRIAEPEASALIAETLKEIWADPGLAARQKFAAMLDIEFTFGPLDDLAHRRLSDDMRHLGLDQATVDRLFELQKQHMTYWIDRGRRSNTRQLFNGIWADLPGVLSYRSASERVLALLNLAKRYHLLPDSITKIVRRYCVVSAYAQSPLPDEPVLNPQFWDDLCRIARLSSPQSDEHIRSTVVTYGVAIEVLEAIDEYFRHEYGLEARHSAREARPSHLEGAWQELNKLGKGIETNVKARLSGVKDQFSGPSHEPSPPPPPPAAQPLSGLGLKVKQEPDDAGESQQEPPKKDERFF